MNLRTRAFMRANVCAIFVRVTLGVLLRSVVSTEREKVKSRPLNRFKKHLVRSFACLNDGDDASIYLYIFKPRPRISLSIDRSTEFASSDTRADECRREDKMTF